MGSVVCKSYNLVTQTFAFVKGILEPPQTVDSISPQSSSTTHCLNVP